MEVLERFPQDCSRQSKEDIALSVVFSNEKIQQARL